MNLEICTKNVSKICMFVTKIQCNALSSIKKTGVSNQTLSNWKLGISEPKTEKLIKIADYFGVPLSYFYGEDDNMTVHSINDNHGIIGNANAPITFNAETGHMLNEQEIELLNIFSNLSVVDKAKVIIYASELVKK